MQVTGQPISPAELGSFEVLENLDDGALEQLAAWLIEIRVEADEIVARQGDPAEAFYLLLQGEVEVFRDAVGEPIATLARLHGGAHFGELGILGVGVRTASVRAVGPCRLLRISKSDLLAFLQGRPALRRLLQDSAARRHSANIAAALALGRRREVRIRLAHKVMLELKEKSAPEDPLDAIHLETVHLETVHLEDMSIGGLCLKGAPEAWRESRPVRFGLCLRNGILPLAGRIAWRRDTRVGITLDKLTPNHDMLIHMTIRALLERQPNLLGVQ